MFLATQLRDLKVKMMNEENIRKAWRKLDMLFGPDYPGRDALLKDAAQAYAESVITANDKQRIGKIGMKHLKLVTAQMLEGKQFSQFLSHVIQYERFLDVE